MATHEDDEILNYHGQVLRSRFRNTDTWRLIRRHGWQLIASQVLALQQDPPAIPLYRGELCEYSGTYRLTDGITAVISCAGEGLTIERTGRPNVVYRAELRDVFFAPGEPRTRRIFERDRDGRITGFVDRREGRDIVWRRDPR